jgi:hypothetical protein
MFGKATWFRTKTTGWGLHPATWQGWGYMAGWIGVIAIPFLILLSRQQGPESLVWLAASLATLSWDVRSIRHALDPAAARPVMFIADDGSCESYAGVRRS